MRTASSSRPASSATARGGPSCRARRRVFEQVGYVSEKRELLEEQTVEGLARFVAALHGDRFDGPGFEAPERPLATPEGPGGWGLYLVDQCAIRWGNERAERHRVWLELERRDAA